MFFLRLYFLCVAVLVATRTLGAEPENPSQTPEKSARKALTEQNITFNSVHTDGPYIAMTFDDGPSATAREGHEIGNHSWSHPNFGKMSEESVRSQLRRTDDAIKNATGKRPTLMRPPYGSITDREKHWIHDEFGYQIILWDVDPYDWRRPGLAVVRNRILKETQPGSIVLSHDIHPGTIEAMPSTFDALEAKGFKFVTVSELIRMAVSQAPHPGSHSGGNSQTKATPTPSLTPSPASSSSG